MVNQGRWMLRDEDSESRNLYIPLILDRVESDHISAYILALPAEGTSIRG